MPAWRTSYIYRLSWRLCYIDGLMLGLCYIDRRRHVDGRRHYVS
jgi:hypothetical protein